MIFFYEKRLLELIAFRKGSFSKCENTKSILLPGASPPGPQRTLPLYPAGGLGGPQTPRQYCCLRHQVPSTFCLSPST